MKTYNIIRLAENVDGHFTSADLIAFNQLAIDLEREDYDTLIHDLLSLDEDVRDAAISALEADSTVASGYINDYLTFD